jgi:hypothetical protein
VVFFWVFGWVAYFVGKWMGGKGTFSEVMAAYIWCTPPAFIGILLNVIAVIPTWAKVFSGVTDEKLLLAPQMGWQSILVTLYSLSILWYVALMIVAISESHRISMWRSLALGLVVIILSIGVGIVLGVILVVSGHH